MNKTTHSFVVGDQCVDPVACTLLGPEGAHHVSPQMIDVIGALAEHAGEPIERGRIINEVWQGDPQGDRSLTRCISSLRRFMGDSRQKPRYIETIPGYGYRLIAPVRPLIQFPAAPTVEKRVEPQPPLHTSSILRFLLELRQRKVCRAALVYAVAIWLTFQIADVVFSALRFPDWALSFVVVAGILGFPIALILAWVFEVTPTGLVLDIPCAAKTSGRRVKRDSRWNYVLLAASFLISFQMLISTFDGVVSAHDEAEQLRNARSIVVTPFRATSVNLETKAYAFGLSEELRHLLRSEFGLNVIAADASVDLTNGHRKADLLLDGSVTMTQDIIRVMVHLVDPLDGHDIWSDVALFTRNRTNESQHQVAREILAVLPIGQDAMNEEPDSLLARMRDQLAFRE